MKKKLLITFLVCCGVLLYGCGGSSSASNSEKSESTSSSVSESVVEADSESEVAEQENTESEVMQEEEKQEEADDFVLKASPDKYTQYVDKYVGMNAASVGYTSLGGDRMVEIGSGLLKITFVTEDGSYVGVEDEENLKNYVVTGQNIEPNTEVKLEFEKDDEGNEYDNLVSFQTYEKIDLAVAEVGSESEGPDLTAINPASDKYTYYIQNYVGKNAASCGYESLAGDYRDAYGKGSILINLVADDGSFIDVSDVDVLKQYVVTKQNIEPNTELKYTFMTDSDGTEMEGLVDSQTYDAITLNVKTVTGEPVVKNEAEEEQAETEDTTKSESTESTVSDAGVDPELKEFLDSYEAFVDEYIEFMNKYNDAGTNDVVSMLNDYTEYMKKLADFSEKAQQYDQNTMSTADLSYYLDVTNRINQKLLKVAG